jgi:hypothetical protein
MFAFVAVSMQSLSIDLIINTVFSLSNSAKYFPLYRIAEKGAPDRGSVVYDEQTQTFISILCKIPPFADCNALPRCAHVQPPTAWAHRMLS